jgi:hypothetical protein
MGLHAGVKDKIRFLKSIGGKNYRPAFFPKDTDQIVDSRDYISGEWRDWKRMLGIKNIFNQVDD